MSWTFSGQVALGLKITTERIATTNQKFTTPSSGDPSVDDFMGIACCRPPRAHTQVGDERGREKIDKLSIQSSEHEKYMKRRRHKCSTQLALNVFSSKVFFLFEISQGGRQVWKCEKFTKTVCCSGISDVSQIKQLLLYFI